MTEKKPTPAVPETGGVFRIRHLLYLTLAGLFALAIFSYVPEDAQILSGGVEAPIGNWIGYCGAWSALVTFYLIGLAAYLAAVIALLAALRPLLPLPLHRHWFWPGVAATLFGASLLLALQPQNFAGVCAALGLGRSGLSELALSGGMLGQVLAAPQVDACGCPAGWLRLLLGTAGTLIVGTLLLVAGSGMLYFSEWHAVLKGAIRACRLPELADDPGEEEPSAAPARKLKAAEPEGPEPDKTDKPSLLERMKQGLRRDRAGEVEAEATPAVRPSDAVEPELPLEPERPAATEPPAPPKPAPAIPSPAPAVSAAANAAPAAGTAIKNADVAPARVVEKGTSAPAPVHAQYVLPPVTMLSKGADIAGESPEVIARNREILQNTLDSFKVAGTVTGHVSGPRVTRYEISLSPGVKVNKVTEIEDNIAKDLQAINLRILAPVPGRNVIGVEVPNSHAETILMRSILDSPAWQNNRYDIPVVLGKDISGEPEVIDLAKAPHLLIAGTTGSGKSVCMNTLIMSLLMKFSPDDLRIIMVDPKVVEMAPYQRLPHLITPVIHDSRKVPVALRWAAVEMDRRYDQLARAGVRKLSEYNRRTLPAEPILDADGIPIPDKLPILLIIIDELADLMNTDAKSEVETNINRITAKGRAAGVHIVVATQSPRKDVITGTIKANLPTRIAFRVTALIDSRVILDQKGAEKLLGMGDMLLSAPNSSMELKRVQGAMISDADIGKIVEFVAAQADQHFDDRVLSDPDAEEGSEDGEDSEDWTEEDADRFIDNGFATENEIVKKYLRPGDDELVRKVLEVIVLEKKVSTSYIQRRLKIGYNRAAELIDLMEERGIVGPPSGSGSKREILIFDGVIDE